MKKLFLVASVSSNTNSFGLYGMILMARDGETWEVAANSLNVKKKGEALAVPMTPARQFTHDEDRANWSGFGFEIPRRLPDAPRNVIEEVTALIDTGSRMDELIFQETRHWWLSTSGWQVVRA